MIKFKRTILLTLLSMGLVVANAAIADDSTEKQKIKQLELIFQMAGKYDEIKGVDGKDALACTPYNWGDTGPDGGVVVYVDGSGCHGMEVQPYDVGVTSNDMQWDLSTSITWGDAISSAAAYNTTPITGRHGLNCSTTAYPSPAAPPATPSCWHLPTKTELQHIEDHLEVAKAEMNYYWTSNASLEIGTPPFRYVTVMYLGSGNVPLSFSVGGDYPQEKFRARAVRTF